MPDYTPLFAEEFNDVGIGGVDFLAQADKARTKQGKLFAAQKYVLSSACPDEGTVRALVGYDVFAASMLDPGMVARNQITLYDQFAILTPPHKI